MKIIKEENSHKIILNATGIFGFGQAMKMFVSIIGSKFVAIFLGPFGIGIVGLLNNTIAIITSLTSFGVNISGAREVTLANAENDQNKLSERFIVLQRWSFLTAILGAFATIIFSKALSKLTFGNTDYYFWFVILSVNFVFANLTTSRIALLQGLRMIKSIAISNVVTSILITLFTIPIYYFFKFDGILAVILVSSFINFAVNLYYTRNIKIVNISLSFYETFQKGKPLLKMGFLLSINVIFGQICSYLIKLYLNGNGSSAQIVGLFEVSSVILVSYVGLIFNAMGTDFYPRITEVQNDNSKVKELVNSYSLKVATDKIAVEESKKGGNTGIVTTHDELKYYHIIKTLLVQTKKIDSDRISYKDQKNSFVILVDGNIRKAICYLVFTDKVKKITVGNKEFKVEKIDDVLSFKKDLTESALPHFE